jgi:ribosome maturation factor RimP
MTDEARTLTSGIDSEKLDGVIEPIARAHGAEVVGHELKSERSGWVFRIYVEKLGSEEQKLSTEDAAVDLELCANIARDLSPALDVLDLIPHKYHLEISSPGVERPLRGEKDFDRFAGKKAKVKLRNAIRGQKVLTGLIGPVRDGHVSLEDGPSTYDVPLGDVVHAHLVFEFGPAPRPGKHPGKKGSGKKKAHKG